MEILGFSLTNRQNQTIAASFCAGTFVLKLLFDRIVKPIVPNYQVSPLSSQATVSLGLATFTTLKIMELAKLIPSVPLLFKVIGGVSTVALMTSGLVKAIAISKIAKDLAPRLGALQQYVYPLKDQGEPFHCSIEMINPNDFKPYLLHVIYNPKGEEIKLFLPKGSSYPTRDVSFMIINPIVTDSLIDELVPCFLYKLLDLGQQINLKIVKLDMNQPILINGQPFERKSF